MNQVPTLVAVDGVKGQLSARMASDATSFALTSGGDLFPSSSFYVQIGDEVILVGGRSGNTFSSLTRVPKLRTGDTGHVHHRGTTVRYVVTGASLAEGTPGGSSALVSCVVRQNTTLDFTAAHTFLRWETILDDTYNGNTLPGLPDGIGLDLVDNGVPFGTSLITTEDGTWQFCVAIEIPNDPDVLFRIEAAFPADLLEPTYGPGVTGQTVSGNFFGAIYLSSPLKLPSGTELDPRVNIFTAPSVSPYNATSVMGTITRLG